MAPDFHILFSPGRLSSNDRLDGENVEALIVNRQSSIVNRQSSIVNRQSSIVNRQSSIV